MLAFALSASAAGPGPATIERRSAWRLEVDEAMQGKHGSTLARDLQDAEHPLYLGEITRVIAGSGLQPKNDGTPLKLEDIKSIIRVQIRAARAEVSGKPLHLDSHGNFLPVDELDAKISRLWDLASLQRLVEPLTTSIPATPQDDEKKAWRDKLSVLFDATDLLKNQRDRIAAWSDQRTKNDDAVRAQSIFGYVELENPFDVSRTRTFRLKTGAPRVISLLAPSGENTRLYGPMLKPFRESGMIIPADAKGNVEYFHRSNSAVDLVVVDGNGRIAALRSFAASTSKTPWRKLSSLRMKGAYLLILPARLAAQLMLNERDIIADLNLADWRRSNDRWIEEMVPRNRKRWQLSRSSVERAAHYFAFNPTEAENFAQFAAALNDRILSVAPLAKAEAVKQNRIQTALRKEDPVKDDTVHLERLHDAGRLLYERLKELAPPLADRMLAALNRPVAKVLAPGDSRFGARWRNFRRMYPIDLAAIAAGLGLRKAAYELRWRALVMGGQTKRKLLWDVFVRELILFRPMRGYNYRDLLKLIDRG